MPITTAIVPAAGLGSRMHPLSDAVPKELLPLGRKAGLQHIAHELAAAGITRIVLVTSEAKLPILRGAFGEQDPQTGTTFVYALQPAMRGLGDAVFCAQPFVSAGEPVLLALGDAVIGEPVAGGLTRRLLESCTDPRTVGLAVQAVPLEKVSRYGVVKPVPGADTSGAAFGIETIVEKPAPENAPSRYAAAARYVLPFAVFETLAQTAPDAKGEVQLTDALRTLLEAGYPGGVVPLTEDETRHDIGGFDSYYRAFLSFALADGDAGVQLHHELSRMLTENKEPVA